jgi:putative transposase
MMANIYSNQFYHIVFRTKSRADFIHQDIERRRWVDIGGIDRKNKLKAIHIGGVENHIHALVTSRPSISPSQIDYDERYVFN